MNRADFDSLIIDLGVSEGNDTAYYLSKGFQVISVEADPATCAKLRIRFQEEINCGALLLLNFAASDTFGFPTDIFVHNVHQSVSGIAKRGEVTDDYTHQSVLTVNWRTLVAQAGVPRYLKIDVEGSEDLFLKGLVEFGKHPEFISVECYQFTPIEKLHKMGYRRFKMVDQNPEGGFKLPAKQLEGRTLENVVFQHSSGPFGLDIFGEGDWTDFEGVKEGWKAASEEFHRTWFDCHAWKPN